jgi:acyl carrier protein
MSVNENVLHTVIDVVQVFAPDGATIEADTPLVDNLALDSANMINVLLELENRLNIQLSAADLTFDHFNNCRFLAEALSKRV